MTWNLWDWDWENFIGSVLMTLLLALLPFLVPLAGVLISLHAPGFARFFGLSMDWGDFWAAAQVILKWEAIVCGVVAVIFVCGLTVIGMGIGMGKGVAHLRSRFGLIRSRFGLTYFALRHFPRAIRLELQGRVTAMMDRLPLSSRACARWGLSPLIGRSSTSAEEFMRALPFLEEFVERLKKEPGLKWDEVRRHEFVALVRKALALRCAGQDYRPSLLPEQGHMEERWDNVVEGMPEGGQSRRVYIVDAPQRIELTPC